MSIDEKKRDIKNNLRAMHLQKNIIDSIEYNQKVNMWDKVVKNSPNKLQDVEKFEQSIALPSSQPNLRVKQVMFRSKSNENASTKAKNLISKLQQEKREREKIKELRTKLEQRRKQTEEDRLKNDQLSQQFENKRIVTERIELMNSKRSIDREIREKEHKEWESKQKEIRSRTYLHEKMQKSIGNPIYVC